MSYQFGRVFRFSAHSRAQLETVDHRLVRVIEVALAISPIDFKVLEGARSDERQQELLDMDPPKTKLRPGESKHNVGPVSGRTLAHAVDLVALPVDWDDIPRASILAGAVFAAAKIVGVKIRWGGDWNRDTRTKDGWDWGHFELDE